MRVIAPKVADVAPASSGDDYLRSNANPEAFGAGVGRSEQQGGARIEQGAAAIGQYVQLKQGIANETAVNDAYSTQFGQPFRELYQKYYALQGRDAVDQRDDYTKQMQDLRTQVRTGLKNPEQQRMFDQVSRRRVEMELDGMARYSDQQNKIWQTQTSDSVLKHQLNDAADKWNDETAFGAALGGGLAEIDRYATRTGQSAEQARERADEFISKAHVQRIQSAMAHDPQRASDLYDQDKENIVAGERPILEHQIKQYLMPVQAKNMAMAIISKDAPKDGAQMTGIQIRAHEGAWFAEAEKQADKLYPKEPGFRDMLMNQIESYTNKIYRAEEGIQRNARDSITRTLITPKEDGSKISDLNELLGDPRMKDAFSRLDGMTQSSVLMMLDHNAKGKDPPETPEAQKLWHDTRGLAYTDPEAFKKLMDDPDKFKDLATKLPHANMNELIGLSSSIDKTAAKDLTMQNNAKRIHAVTDGLLAQAGFKLPKKDEKRQEVLDAYQNWTSRMLTEVQQFTEDNKRRPSDIELRDMGQRLLVKGYETGTGWFGTTFRANQKAAFEMTDIGKLAVKAPPDEVPKITAALTRKYGRPPTTQEIDQLYAVKMMERKQ